jgi:hypothetical protein
MTRQGKYSPVQERHIAATSNGRPDDEDAPKQIPFSLIR